MIARSYSGQSEWVPGTVRTQLGPLSYEVEIKPNLIWCRHTDQLNVCHVPVKDHSPVFHSVPSTTIFENRGDQVAESSEQFEAVSRETVDQSANSVAEYSVSAPTSQFEHVPVTLSSAEAQRVFFFGWIR